MLINFIIGQKKHTFKIIKFSFHKVSNFIYIKNEHMVYTERKFMKHTSVITSASQLIATNENYELLYF